jgi:hypothetical protein
MVEAGESEYSRRLKIRELLIFPYAKNAQTGKIALNWNVSGTQLFRKPTSILIRQAERRRTASSSSSLPNLALICLQSWTPLTSARLLLPIDAEKAQTLRQIIESRVRAQRLVNRGGVEKN